MLVHKKITIYLRFVCILFFRIKRLKVQVMRTVFFCQENMISSKSAYDGRKRKGRSGGLFLFFSGRPENPYRASECRLPQAEGIVLNRAAQRLENFFRDNKKNGTASCGVIRRPAGSGKITGTGGKNGVSVSRKENEGAGNRFAGNAPACTRKKAERAGGGGLFRLSYRRGMQNDKSVKTAVCLLFAILMWQNRRVLLLFCHLCLAFRYVMY